MHYWLGLRTYQLAMPSVVSWVDWLTKIQNTIRILKLKILHDAYYLAKLHEATLAFIDRRKPILEKPTQVPTWVHQPKPNPSATSSSNSSYKQTTRARPSSYEFQFYSQGSSSSRIKKPNRSFTVQELDETRAKNFVSIVMKSTFQDTIVKLKYIRLSLDIR